MPRDQFMYYGIMPDKCFLEPQGDQKPHGVDRTVPHNRGLHMGLTKKRKLIEKNLDKLEEELFKLSRHLGMSIDPEHLDVEEDRERRQLQSTLFYLLQVIHFQKKYLDSPNVDAGIGDELHVANFKDFKLHDGTKLVDMLKAHIHQDKKPNQEFLGGFLKNRDSQEAKAIKRFMDLAKKSFAANRELSAIIERQYPEAAVSLNLSLNLVVGALVDYANSPHKPVKVTTHPHLVEHKRKPVVHQYKRKKDIYLTRRKEQRVDASSPARRVKID